VAIATEPDGRNINDGCGSTDTAALARRMASGEADIGFAFDGGADRVLAVDRCGEARDSDAMIALAAGWLKRQGKLNGGVVVTVMSNHGFRQEMERQGIELAAAAVGDRYVLSEMLERGWSLGGEQSGHLINADFTPTGDGIAS